MEAVAAVTGTAEEEEEENVKDSDVVDDKIVCNPEMQLDEGSDLELESRTDFILQEGEGSFNEDDSDDRRSESNDFSADNREEEGDHEEDHY